MELIYKKHTNGCSPYIISYENDKLEITFDFIPKNEPFKKFVIYANIDLWDGHAFLDFSVLDLYKERLINKASSNSICIYKEDGLWIILKIWSEKILIPAYHHYIYYTSDFELVIEYTEYDNWEIKEEDKKEIDLSKDFEFIT